MTGLETAVRVDPELLRLEELKHLLDAVLDLLLAGNTRRVDVVDTRADVARVSLVNKDLQELGVRLAVLDGENISVKSGNGVEEVLELGVAEVRVDLGGVLDTGNGETEGLDSPIQVSLTLLAGAERETLTESRLVDLDDVDASSLKVNDLVAEGKSKLLSLDGLVDVVTRERPSETGDGTSQHTLHGLLGDGGGELGLLDGHGGRAGDVTDNDRGTDTAGSVRLDPTVGGESVSVHALTEVLHHVVTLGLTVDVDIQVKLLLDLDNLGNLLLDELLVLVSGDLTLGELVTLDTDLLGLGEGADGGSREEGKAKSLLLLGDTLRELRLAVEHLRSNLGLTLLHSRVVGTLGGGTSLHGLGVGLQLLADGSRAFSDSLGNDGNLDDLLAGESEPVSNLRVELLLAGKSVGSVEERAGGGNNDTILAELLDGGLNLLNGTLEVGLPDVAAVNNTSGEDGVGTKGADHSLELLWVADQVNVDGVDVLGKSVNVVDDVTEVGGEDNLGDLGAQAGKLLVGRLEGSLGLGGQVEDERRLVNLDGLGAGLLELGEELLVDGQKLVEESDGVNGLTTVGLSEVEEGDGTNQDGAGGDTSLLGLEELNNSLGVGVELEGLVVLESGLDVVVVRVEPLHHLQRRNIDTLDLTTTTHGEVLIDGVEVVLGISLGGSTEVLDVVEDLVVQSKVVAGNDVDTGILLELPMGQTQALGLLQEVILGDLAAPVGLSSLLEVTVNTHAGETENGSREDELAIMRTFEYP